MAWRACLPRAVPTRTDRNNNFIFYLTVVTFIHLAAEGDHDIRRYTYTGAAGELIPYLATHVFVRARIVPANAFEDHPHRAFYECDSLRSINLPSANNVEGVAFWGCHALREATFGSKLESIKRCAFYDCCSLERITIPLKDGIITHVSIFEWCENLKHVDLVEGELHETVAALQLEEWRNDMNEEIVSINQILPARLEAARAIRTWIRSVLRKVIHYKAEHQRLLNEQVATALEHSLPLDIVMNNVLPFLELPSYTFEVGDHEEGEEPDYFDSEEEDDEE